MVPPAVVSVAARAPPTPPEVDLLELPSNIAAEKGLKGKAASVAATRRPDPVKSLKPKDHKVDRVPFANFKPKDQKADSDKMVTCRFANCNI